MKIKHPTEDNYVLNYEPPYAQQNLLFVQGRAHNTKVIELPEEWLELVDLNNISVHLTPIGANQNLIVKRTERNLIAEQDGLLFLKVIREHLEQALILN